jgi:ribonuclease HIII
MAPKDACFSTKIDISLAKQIERDLIEQGFTITRPPYTLFAASKKGVSCSFYESGSFTVQGKEKDDFIEFYLEPQILGKFQYSHPTANLDLTPRIGLDEAGKGDFFGPLCVAAVFADGPGIQELCNMGVKDSKRFSDDAIAKLAKAIRNQYAHTVIRLFPHKYNELIGKFKNLNRLLAWTHVAALGDLSAKTGCKTAILDQFADPSVVEQSLRQKKLEVNLTQRVRGEEDLVVAAASILARSAFLSGLKELGDEVQFTLPKGASAIVIAAGKELVAKEGEKILDKVAKTHFKTMDSVLKNNH